ncbi:NOTCH1 [Branchiostoma lanceolatum]|uniref:NOTCH1 protein n=1 Tax=Branchiostoma lanceolatum TaxID=7740 RepID=A0A8J9W4B1_BRALA|nr:NOTCH1 [Branchiostoma lanceolatum]
MQSGAVVPQRRRSPGLTVGIRSPAGPVKRYQPASVRSLRHTHPTIPFPTHSERGQVVGCVFSNLQKRRGDKMALCHVMVFVGMVVAAAPFVIGTDLSASGYNVCSRQEEYQQPYTVTVLASRRQVYYTRSWGFQCRRYRWVYSTQHMTRQRTVYRVVYQCCAGWQQSGSVCSIHIDECSYNPCKNVTTCHDGLNSYTCECATGWLGLLCDNDIDECSSNPCQNGATCHDGLTSYTCDCASGWEGLNCENGPVMETSPSTLTTKPGVTSDNEPELTVLARLNVSLTLTAPRSVTLSSLRNSIIESLEQQTGVFCKAQCEIGEIFLLDVTDPNGARKKRQAADDEIQFNVIIQLIVLANQEKSYTSNATVAAENLIQEKAEALRKLARSGILSVSIDGEKYRLMDNSDNSKSCPPGQDYNTDGSCEKERNTAQWLIGVICAAVLVIIIIAVVAVLIYRRKHKPSASLHGKSGNEMTNLETPGRRRDHTGSDGSVDNIIYNTDDEGFVDNVIYNAVDAGTDDNAIYNAVDAGTMGNAIYNADDAGTMDNAIYNADDAGTVDNAIYNTDDTRAVDNAIYNAVDAWTEDNAIYNADDAGTVDNATQNVQRR